MGKSSGARWRHARRLTLLGGLALLTAACTTANDDVGNWFHVDWLADYTEKHQLLGEEKVAWLRNFRIKKLPVYTEVTNERFPVTVEPRVAIFTIPGAAADVALSAADRTRLDAFIGAYLTRGHGQLTIAVPGTGDAEYEAIDRGILIVDHALSRGLRQDEIVLRVETAPTGTKNQIVASYETFDLRVPVCGDWSKESSHDLTNTVHSNFGCSVQRDFALMVANPADLVTMRAPAPHDAGRSSTVLSLYRAGKTTGAERAGEERAALSTIGATK